MSNNNHYNSPCGFAEDLVSYLYGEIDSAEKTRFERHLDDCSNCGKELAGFGFVRSSIGDWREEMFSVLETHKIEIPYIEKQTFVKTSVNSNDSLSWLASLRNVFSLSPTWATTTTVFASIAVLVGITIFALNFSYSNQVLEAKIIGNTSQNGVNAERVEIESANQPEEKDRTNLSLAGEKTSENNDLKINKKNSLPEKIVAEITPKSIKIPKNSRENKKPSDKTMANTNINPGKNSNTSKSGNIEVPKLTNFSEEEDNSLRLADLFDEVGSK